MENSKISTAAQVLNTFITLSGVVNLCYTLHYGKAGVCILVTSHTIPVYFLYIRVILKYPYNLFCAALRKALMTPAGRNTFFFK